MKHAIKKRRLSNTIKPPDRRLVHPFHRPLSQVKCVVVGDGAVGKTCLLVSYGTGAFPGEYIPTVHDNTSAHIMHNGRQVTIGLWDTPGQEDYDRLRPLSYPDTNIFLVCYSIISRSSYDNARFRWIPEIQHHEATTPFIIVATKKDLRNDPNVARHLDRRGETILSPEDGEELKSATGAAAFVECSALTQDGLRALFETAVSAAR